MKRITNLVTALAFSALGILAADVARAVAPEAGTPAPSGSSPSERLFAELDQAAEPGDNVVFSPLSLEQAFGILHAGARGETQAQIEAFFQWPAGVAADRELQRRREALLASAAGVPIGEERRRQLEALGYSTADTELRFANALWISDQFKIKPVYRRSVERFYNAVSEELNFGVNAATSAARINSWTSDQTEGLIDQIVGPNDLSEEIVVLLTTSLYFSAEWQGSFNRSSDKPFLFGDGHEEPFSFMNSMAHFAVAEHDGWRAVRLPYRRGGFVMDVIIPTQRSATAAAPPAATLAALTKALSGPEAEQYVDLTMPQFEIESIIDFKQAFASAGLTLPFDRERADLTGIVPLGPNPTYVAAVKQVLKLQVDRWGTKAAAVTSLVPIQTTSLIPGAISFIVDRPFVVSIHSLETGDMLFQGRIAHPAPLTQGKTD